MKSFAYLVQMIHQHGVFFYSTGFEVHIYTVFRQRTGHQFAVGRNDVSAVGFHRYILLDETVGHILPVLSFGKHRDACFDNNGYSYQSHQQDDEEVAGHYIFLVYSHLLFRTD